MTLLALLKSRIGAEGPISLSDFMALALSDPKHGYYQTRDPFAQQGDFTTSPEISQMYGELIGLWCVDYWMKIGAPENFHLVELGPGSGRLMQDALRSARLAPEFLAAARIHMVENSPVLKARQQQTLADFNLHWHDRLDTVADGPMILIANEFFDALPIRQFTRTAGGWLENHVGLDSDSALTLVALECPNETMPALPPAHQAAKPRDVIEVNEAAQALITKIAERIQRYGGAALIIDYGPAASAVGDSLQAVAHQQYTDPLNDPGNADLTAHVDFQRLAELATIAGCRTQGVTSQGRFLERLGIEARAAILQSKADDDQKQQIASAYKRLVSSAEMGTLFKVIALIQAQGPLSEGFEDSHASK